MTFSFQINETKFENKTTVAHKKKKRQREREGYLFVSPKESKRKEDEEEKWLQNWFAEWTFYKKSLVFFPNRPKWLQPYPLPFYKKKKDRFVVEAITQGHYIF